MSAAIVMEIGEEDFVEESAAAKGQMIVAGLGGRRVCIGGSQKRLKMLR